MSKDAVSIEVMREELEAAGYEIEQSPNFVSRPACVKAPDGWVFYPPEPSSHWMKLEDAKREEMQAMVTAAYSHLQERRELEALREFVEKVANSGIRLMPANDNPENSTFLVSYAEYDSLAEEAKRLRGKE